MRYLVALPEYWSRLVQAALVNTSVYLITRIAVPTTHTAHSRNGRQILSNSVQTLTNIVSASQNHAFFQRGMSKIR